MVTDNLAFVVFALHLLADFQFQTDWMAENKLGGGVAHFSHVAVHLLAYSPLYLLYGATGAYVALFVAGSHALIDLRRWPAPQGASERVPIWVDQSLHVASIALAVVLFA